MSSDAMNTLSPSSPTPNTFTTRGWNREMEGAVRFEQAVQREDDLQAGRRRTSG